MASGLYAKWKEAVMQGAANSSLGGTVQIVLIDIADYTPDLANHEFMTSVPAGSRVGTPQTLGSKTFVGGVFDAADSTFPTVTGDPCEALLIFISTGADATARPVALIDSATGLPVTPNGGDISVTYDGGSNKIFKL